MAQLTIVSHGDSAAVVLPAAFLESAGLNIGDVLDIRLGERELILRSAAEAVRSEQIEAITKDVFTRRADAYRRLA